MAYNRDAAAEAMTRTAAALGVSDAAQGVFDLVVAMGGPTSLEQLGMPEDGLDKAADLATQNPYWNPRPIERGPLRELLDNAYHGRRPK
jgi:alcohol dehydrogenase class IV